VVSETKIKYKESKAKNVIFAGLKTENIFRGLAKNAIFAMTEEIYLNLLFLSCYDYILVVGFVY
jgi:hypothetical protein